MSLTAQDLERTAEERRAPVTRHPRRLARLVPSLTGGRPALLAWARLVTEAADRRVAELEARLAYLEGLTVTDELTSALNRRGFINELGRAIAAARRGSPGGVLVLGDLDGFKAVNDRFGHAAGNELLHQVVALLTRRVRRMDVVARLGGDEFALLLIGANLASARRKCQCLGKALATLPQIEGEPVPLSASFGIVAFDGSEDEEALLHRADMAMYDEKHARGGRREAIPAELD